jgi:hypothetical protein
MLCVIRYGRSRSRSRGREKKSPTPPPPAKEQKAPIVVEGAIVIKDEPLDKVV